MQSRPRDPALAAHRLLGDGRSTALLRPQGEIDWLCAPAMDAPPLLWSLLDPAGAAARWPGARLVGLDPRPAGATASTALRIAGVAVDCLDGLVAVGDGSVLVRLVRCPTRELDVVHELSVGGFDQPAGEWAGAVASLGSCSVRVDGGESEPDGRVLRTRLRAEAGVWAALVVGVDATLDLPPAALAERLLAAAVADDEVLSRPFLPRHHPERAADALAVLRACTFEPTGAVIASPTTSLPEAPGADRQFDYRYTWLRDASLGVSVAALLGERDIGRRYLRFVHQVAGPEQVPTPPMSDIRAEGVPDEREIPGVRGWAESRPVRVGNAARDQKQYDALGLLVEGVSVHLQTGGSLDDDTWALIRAVADRLAEEEDGAPAVSNGIWELRDAGPLVDGDIGRWLALDRAVWIARMRHPWHRRRHWLRARDAARARVEAALGEDGGLPQRYDDPSRRADASALLAPLFGMLPKRQGTRVVDAVLRDLGAGAHVYRYEPGRDDGFQGREATFVPMSAWAIGALAAVGRVDEAVARLDELCASLPRLLAEEFDVENGESLGNVPLVWSHVALARALYLVDAAVLRRRFGLVGLTLWRVVRYVRLRRRA